MHRRYSPPPLPAVSHEYSLSNSSCLSLTSTTHDCNSLARPDAACPARGGDPTSGPATTPHANTNRPLTSCSNRYLVIMVFDLSPYIAVPCMMFQAMCANRRRPPSSHTYNPQKRRNTRVRPDPLLNILAPFNSLFAGNTTRLVHFNPATTQTRRRGGRVSSWGLPGLPPPRPPRLLLLPLLPGRAGAGAAAAPAADVRAEVFPAP